MKDFIEIIKTRKSVRSFSDKKVSEEDINKILECGDSAPSANGVYPREIKHYQDREILKMLSQTQSWSSFVAEASVCFVVLGYPHRSKYWVEDCSAVAQNILLAVHALGLGACWVAVRNMKNEGEPASEYVKKILSLPDDSEVLCLIPVGYSKK